MLSGIFNSDTGEELSPVRSKESYQDKNRSMLVIGEPRSGKTTLIREEMKYFLKNTPDSVVVLGSQEDFEELVELQVIKSQDFDSKYLSENRAVLIEMGIKSNNEKIIRDILDWIKATKPSNDLHIYVESEVATKDLEQILCEIAMVTKGYNADICVLSDDRKKYGKFLKYINIVLSFDKEFFVDPGFKLPNVKTDWRKLILPRANYIAAVSTRGGVFDYTVRRIFV